MGASPAGQSGSHPACGERLKFDSSWEGRGRERGESSSLLLGRLSLFTFRYQPPRGIARQVEGGWCQLLLPAKSRILIDKRNIIQQNAMFVICMQGRE